MYDALMGRLAKLKTPFTSFFPQGKKKVLQLMVYLKEKSDRYYGYRSSLLLI